MVFVNLFVKLNKVVCGKGKKGSWNVLVVFVLVVLLVLYVVLVGKLFSIKIYQLGLMSVMVVEWIFCFGKVKFDDWFLEYECVKVFVGCIGELFDFGVICQVMMVDSVMMKVFGILLWFVCDVLSMLWCGLLL